MIAMKMIEFARVRNVPRMIYPYFPSFSLLHSSHVIGINEFLSCEDKLQKQGTNVHNQLFSARADVAAVKKLKTREFFQN